MWRFLVFIEFVTVLLLFYVLVFFWPGGIWDLRSPPAQDGTLTLHWATREVPLPLLFSQSEEESSQLLA